jgi:hypothetical protein
VRDGPASHARAVAVGSTREHLHAAYGRSSLVRRGLRQDRLIVPHPLRHQVLLAVGVQMLVTDPLGLGVRAIDIR